MTNDYTKKDAMRYASDETSPYGNIYYPYHIQQTTSDGNKLRYRVLSIDTGHIAIVSTSWSTAVLVARMHNAK